MLIPDAAFFLTPARIACRLPCGQEVALKLAPSGSAEEQQLKREARAYRAVQELWGAGVPELLLAGPLVAFGPGYGVGTAVLPGRRLQPGAASLCSALQLTLTKTCMEYLGLFNA